MKKAGHNELSLIITFVLSLFLSGFAHAGTTELASVSSDGVQANNQSIASSISDDGHFIAFASDANNLVDGDANGFRDIFVRDLQTGSTEIVSISTSGEQGNGDCNKVSISGDGRFVTFLSSANNLVDNDTNGTTIDTFVHDRLTKVTERVSVSSLGEQGNADCIKVDISSDGQYVAFESRASNLVEGDTNNIPDVFVHDRVSNMTERVSISSAGVEQNNSVWSYGQISISGDGRFVAFDSLANNLVDNDTNNRTDVFVHDRLNKTTELVSVSSTGEQGARHPWLSTLVSSWRPSISADGRYIAFASCAPNLIVGDTNDTEDIFVHDRETGITERVNISSSGAEARGLSYWNSTHPSISANGRFVTFYSRATNLVDGSQLNPLYPDIYIRDRIAGITEIVSVSDVGEDGNDYSDEPTVSADGRYVAFWSYASNLIEGDQNSYVKDIFIRDLQTPQPVTTTISITGTQDADGFYTSDVAVTIHKTNNNSGLTEQFDYSLDNVLWEPYTGPFTITPAGITTIYLKELQIQIPRQ